MQKHFYYTNSKKIFTNKIDATRHKELTGEKIFYYYHDEVYSKLDWTIEPPGSLDFHYQQQAQRIRDEYDYVVLFYSGGYDSTNILETFHFNNIKLDKIVCVGAFKQDTFSGVDENHNGEIYNNCFPYIVELGLESITQICDYTDYFNDVKNFSVYEYGEQWVENNGGWFSPHHWFWRDIHKYVVPANMRDKKVALIWGKDKPYIETIGNDICFSFNDMATLGYGMEIEIDNIDRIHFYWDPNYPFILIKQLHTLMKMKSFNPDNVYNLKRPILFKSPKSPSNLLSLRDKFLMDNTNSSIFDFYQEGIRRLLKQVNPNNLSKSKSKSYVVKYGNK